MRCPVDSSFLRDQRYDGDVVAACHQCHGLWLRVTDVRSAAMRDALGTLVQPPRRTGAARTRPTTPDMRACPECRRPLVTQTVVGVEIEGCAACRGIWLDAGELPAIASWHQRRALAPHASEGPVAMAANAAVDRLVEAGATSVFETVGELGTAIIEFTGECLAGLFDGV